MDGRTVRSVRPRKQTLNPDQIPLITPSSDWTVPASLPDLTRIGEIGLDTETRDNGLASGRGPGWAFGDGYVAGVGVAWREGGVKHKIYVPIRHPETECFPRDQVARWVTDITRKNRVVMFNAGYDMGWLQTDLGVPTPPVIDDASCAAFLIDENRQDLDLDSCCEWRGVPGKDLRALEEAAVIYGIRAQDAVKNLWRLPARYAGPYGQQDPESTLDLMHSFRPELARQGLLRAYDVEMRLIPIIGAMRRRGIRVNVERAERLRDELFARSKRVFGELSDRLKMTVGIDEIRQHSWMVRTFSNENVRYESKGEGDDARASFEKDWMRAAEHWLPRMIAEAKQCHEMAEKFIQTYLLDFAHLGRIHASINQWKYEEGGTRSHRLSYSEPPLQQAPSRPDRVEGWTLTGEIAQEYRSCLEPEIGDLWFAPDYSQQEYRLIVTDAEERGCNKADVAAQMYRDDPNTDFHNLVVSLTELPRRDAKDCNFAKAFGAGKFKFSQMIGKSLEEASDIMDKYDTEMPFVKEISQICSSAASRRGYIRMFDGARSHFDTWEAAWVDKDERKRGYDEGYRMSPCSESEARERATLEGHPWQGKRLKRAMTHKALNRRIQGNAARQMKLAMVTCGEEGHVPLIQMHDELGFSLSSEKTGKRIVEIMRTVHTCTVPFLVDAEWGANWGDAKHTFKAADRGRAAATVPPRGRGRAG